MLSPTIKPSSRVAGKQAYRPKYVVDSNSVVVAADAAAVAAGITRH